MLKAVQGEGQGVLIELNAVHGGEISTHHITSDQFVPDAIKSELQRYFKVFTPIHGLPSTREHDHSIELVQGARPVSVRPYRYPRFQKDEIERLVTEMLTAGIIQPSTSPFSSPVLLVKKKDGSWRFCVDY